MWRPKNKGPVSHETAGDDLVQVACVGSIEAELFAGQLREEGIDAAVFGPGTAGENAALAFSEGSRVMVRRRDADRALSLLGM